VKHALLAIAVAAALVVPAKAGGLKPLPPSAATGEQVFYGHIASLTPSGRRYLLRFDPAWLLEGITAQRAAVADGVLPPGEPVPNDVPRAAKVTVLTNGPTSAKVTVVELAQLLAGRNPRHRALFGTPRSWGYWALVRIDEVRSLDAQYHP
jgi:hypothetical protein